MDLSRLGPLAQFKLHASAEGRGFIYLLADRASGRILRLSRSVASSWMEFQRPTGNPPDRTNAQQVTSALQVAMRLRDSDRLRQAQPNPLSIRIELFDVGPYQSRLSGLARFAFGKIMFCLLMIGLACAVFLGVRNNWELFAEFRNVFSLEALLTFGLIAPVLKVIHEFGHVLAATVKGVRVRKAGLYLIGFYPSPYVDCSEADLVAPRNARILISCAGILTDFSVGLLAFLLWYVVEDAEVKSLLGRVFVFSTLNSALFNINPLMRMDGHHVLADIIGRRGFGTMAARHASGLLRWIVGASRGAEFPKGREAWLLTGFGLASTGYRLLVLWTIVLSVLPAFLGGGVLLGLWGGWVMLAEPMVRTFSVQDAAPQETAPAGSFLVRRWKLILILILGILLAFLPVSSRLVINMQPDAQGSYAVSATRSGIVVELAAEGPVTKGAILARLANTRIADAVTQAELGVLEARQGERIGRSTSAAATAQGEDRLTAALDMQALALAEQAELVIRAPRDGMFVSTSGLRIGKQLSEGRPVGLVLPMDGEIVLTGPMPESHMHQLEGGISELLLWDGNAFQSLDPATARVAELIKQDRQTLRRTYTLSAKGRALGADYTPDLFVEFNPQPVWKHIQAWINNTVAIFRESEMADRANRLEMP